MTATRNETTPNVIRDGIIVVVVAPSLIAYVMRRYPIPVLTHVIVTTPMKMNRPAMLRAKQNLARCFKFKMKPFHALEQKLSPVTAM